LSVARRLLGAALVLAVSAVAVAGLIALLSSRDRSTFSGPSGAGASLGAGDRHLPPGTRDPRYSTRPPTSGAHVVVPVRRDGVALSDDQLLSALELGNVVLVYRTRAQAAGLRSLAVSVGGPFDVALAAAGQAVILEPSSDAPAGVSALAWGHALTVASPADPALRSFASYWLGRGAPTGARG